MLDVPDVIERDAVKVVESLQLAGQPTPDGGALENGRRMPGSGSMGR
jgi:hypothetical protein